MKLIFEKKDSQNITVRIGHEGNIKDFDYIEMLKGLLLYGSLEAPEVTGDFSEDEKNSINSMVKQLNGCVPVKDSQTYLDSELVTGNIKPDVNA